MTEEISRTPRDKVRVTSFAPPLSSIPTLDLSLSGLIFAHFLEMINTFKKGLIGNKEQLEFMGKLSKEVAKLMDLFNQIGDPNMDPVKLEKAYNAQVAMVKNYIYYLADSGFKSQLTKSLDEISGLLNNNQMMNIFKELGQKIAQFNAVLSFFKTYQHRFDRNGYPIVPPNWDQKCREMLSAASGIGAYIGSGGLLSLYCDGIEQALGKQAPAVLRNIKLGADTAWQTLMNSQSATILNFKIRDWGKKFGERWSTWEAWNKSPPDKRGPEPKLPGFTVEMLNMSLALQGKYSNSYDMRGWGEVEGKLANLMKFSDQVTFASGTSVTLLRKMMETTKNSETLRGMMAPLWQAYTGAIGSLNQMLSTGMGMSNDMVTSLHSTSTAVNMIFDTLNKSLTTITRAAEKSEREILKRR